MAIPYPPDHPLLNTIVVCDGGQHEARVITDGATVYGYLLDGSFDFEAASLVMADLHVPGDPGTVEARCPFVDTLSDEQCHGYITVRLTDWTTAGEDPEGADALASYGGPVES